MWRHRVVFGDGERSWRTRSTTWTSSGEGWTAAISEGVRRPCGCETRTCSPRHRGV